MILPIFVVAAAALIASGVLWQHQRVLTYLAAAGALFDAQWLLLALIDRTLARPLPSTTVFMAGGIVLLLIWIAFYKRWTIPYLTTIGSGRRDVFVLLVTAVVLLAAWLVAQVNGFAGQAWVAHGFYNGDTVTLAALVEKSLATNGLVRDNPFAGNGPLEYPTLLHGGLASFLSFTGISDDWLRYLPLATYVQILITIPLFFLLFDTVYPEPVERWRLWLGIRSRLAVLALQAVVVLYVLALSWDNYIYPQSHFFLTSLFIMLLALLARGYSEKAWREYLWSVTATMVALVLLLSNAVTGTAAVAAVSVFFLLRAGDKRRPIWQRIDYVIGALLLGVTFLFFLPGQPAFGAPSFSYVGALDMLRLAPVLLALMASVWLKLEREHVLTSSVAVLSALAFFTFVFSNRDIVVANASRFFYHAVIASFVLLLAPMIRLWFWLRRQLLFTSHSITEQAVGWLSVLIMAGLFLLPAGASVASAHDNLMLKDVRVIDFDMRQILWWIEDSTAPDSIFLASPNPPWAIPMFTGRALLRADFWLSPDDVVYTDVVAAFAGNPAARERVVSQADYIVLTKEDQSRWGTLPLEKAIETSSAVVYKLK